VFFRLFHSVYERLIVAKNLIGEQVDIETKNANLSEIKKDILKKDRYILFQKGLISMLKLETDKYEDFARIIFGTRKAYLLLVFDKLLGTTTKSLVNIHHEDLCQKTI